MGGLPRSPWSRQMPGLGGGEGWGVPGRTEGMALSCYVAPSPLLLQLWGAPLSHLSPQTPFTPGLAEKGDDTFTALCPPGAGEPRHPSLTLLMFQGTLWFLALSSTEFLPWVWQPAWVRGTRLVPKVWGCLLARGFGWEGV